jgi:hypothetical protein
MSRSDFVENVISESGAGFGNAVQNRKVERAAVRQARRVYESRGFHVASCEAKKCGYDLIARNGRRELHIEVKGVAGDLPEFNITENELAVSKIDKVFRLIVVTSALRRAPKIFEWSGSELIKHYSMRAIAYRATPK